jgi:hypothetical protein
MTAHKRLGTTGILATLVALVAGCGGGGGKAATIDDFCTQKAEKECLVTVVSCVSDAGDCKTARKKVCTDWAAAVQTADAKRVFKAANVAACVSKAQSVYALDTIKPSDLTALDDTCAYVFQGTVAKDSECTSKYDCTDKSLICDKGLCAEKVSKGTDALCADPGAVCGAAQYCGMMGAVLKCINKVGKGDSCATAPCLDTLRCSAATCMDPIAAGEACATSADCVPAAPYCDPAAGNLCTPGLKFATHSASCGPFGDTKAAAIPAGTAGSTGTAGSGGATGSAGAGGTTGAAGAGGAGGSGGATGAGGADGSAGAGGATGAAGSDAGTTD